MAGLGVEREKDKLGRLTKSHTKSKHNNRDVIRSSRLTNKNNNKKGVYQIDTKLIPNRGTVIPCRSECVWCIFAGRAGRIRSQRYKSCRFAIDSQ